MWQYLLAQTLAAAEGDYWADEFFGLGPEQRFVVILTILGCVTGIIISLVSILSYALGAVHRRRTEANLKREMLDRGMSVDEIVKLIEAAAPPEDAAGRWIASWCKHK
jgi:hypothetical protein